MHYHPEPRGIRLTRFTRADYLPFSIPMYPGNPVPKAKSGLDISETEDGFVVFQPELDRVHYLNHSAVLVLELCNGTHTAAEIAAVVQQAYALAEPPTAKVDELLASLRRQGLLEVDSER